MWSIYETLISDIILLSGTSIYNELVYKFNNKISCAICITQSWFYVLCISLIIAIHSRLTLH